MKSTKSKGWLGTASLVLAAALATGCSGATTDDPTPSGGGAADGTEGAGGDEAAIIGGTTDKTDHAIVELVAAVGGGEYTCTASFISKTTLVTAAHCVVDENHPYRLMPGATFHLMTATSDAVATSADRIPVKRANIHPHPSFDGDAAHDVAVVVIEQPFDVTPIPVRLTPLPTSYVGRPVRIVGYGQTSRFSDTGVGKRRSVQTTLRKFEGNLLLIGRTGQQACDGDSGGPALMRINGVETIIGLDDVAATSVNCAGGDLYQRTDRHASFLAPYL